MPLVLEASIALAWLLNEPHRPAADRAIEQGLAEGLAAPELFWIEVANVLGQQVRRGKLTSALRDAALADLQLLRISQHPSAERLSDIIALSDRHGLTVYDACYLELAIHQQAALATLDRDLAAAAEAQGVQAPPA